MLGLAVLLAVLLAGPASAAEYETVPFETAAADGIVLRGHAFLPEGRERPLATVLQFSPYFEDTDEVESSDSVGPLLLDEGFAVSYVSMRGTGRSDGCLRFGDGTDWTDAHTVVQALAVWAAVFVVVLDALTEFALARIDPRVRARAQS